MDFLHMGHKSDRSFNHGSIHVEWNPCEHGKTFTLIPSIKSSKQIAQLSLWIFDGTSRRVPEKKVLNAGKLLIVLLMELDEEVMVLGCWLVNSNVVVVVVGAVIDGAVVELEEEADSPVKVEEAMAMVWVDESVLSLSVPFPCDSSWSWW